MKRNPAALIAVLISHFGSSLGQAHEVTVGVGGFHSIVKLAPDEVNSRKSVFSGFGYTGEIRLRFSPNENSVKRFGENGILRSGKYVSFFGCRRGQVPTNSVGEEKLRIGSWCTGMELEPGPLSLGVEYSWNSLSATSEANSNTLNLKHAGFGLRAGLNFNVGTSDNLRVWGLYYPGLASHAENPTALSAYAIEETSFGLQYEFRIINSVLQNGGPKE